MQCNVYCGIILHLRLVFLSNQIGGYRERPSFYFTMCIDIIYETYYGEGSFQVCKVQGVLVTMPSYISLNIKLTHPLNLYPRMK